MDVEMRAKEEDEIEHVEMLKINSQKNIIRCPLIHFIGKLLITANMRH